MNEYGGAFWNGRHGDDGEPCENDGGLAWNTVPGGGGTPCICDGGGPNGDGWCAGTERGGG